MRRVGVFLIVLVLSVSIGAGAVAGSLLLIVPAIRPLGHIGATARVPPLQLAPLSQRSVILDRYGQPITQLYAGEDRDPVKLRDVPARVVAAVLATEDRSFFAHSGVDYKGILRAFVKDVQTGEVRQGGSTITQQLVKNTLFQSGRKRTARDKSREAVLAIRLEQNYSKEQILERYLNTVYFGRGAYGLKAAAERWFNRPVQELNVPEAALLAGMIASPGRYDPIDNPSEARGRRGDVLGFMAATGAITPFEVTRFARAPLPTKTFTAAEFAPKTYFVDAMAKWLEDDNPAGRALGDTAAARRYQLYHGGLRITTTYDPVMQAQMNAAVTGAAVPKPIETGMVTIDNATGAVRAMWGGPDFATAKYNLATQGRLQPGSSFKPFTLAAALEAGYSPNDSINGSSTCSFRPPLSTAPYDVFTTDGIGVGPLRNMIAKSINCAFVRLVISLGAGTVGPSRAIEVARRLGVSNETALAKVTSITLGVSPVSPLDMAAAYSTVASDGVRRDPMYVTRIVAPDDTVLYDAPASRARPVMSPQVARTLIDMLRGVIAFGTATRANIGRPAAGKTGTTDNSVAAWFIGFTPQLTTAVAIGKPSCQNTDDPACSLSPPLAESDAFGGRKPALIWAAFMQAALQGQPPLDFQAPDPSLWPIPSYIDERGRRGPAALPALLPAAPAAATVPTTTAPSPP